MNNVSPNTKTRQNSAGRPPKNEEDRSFIWFSFEGIVISKAIIFYILANPVWPKPRPGPNATEASFRLGGPAGRCHTTIFAEVQPPWQGRPHSILLDRARRPRRRATAEENILLLHAGLNNRDI